jgi:hypothetical protein
VASPRVLVVVAARAPAVADALGPSGAERLGEALAGAATAWGRTVGEVEVVTIDAFATALARAAPPVVAIGTDMPTLGPFHADALRADLAAGVDAVFGPAHDGGCYLLALGSEQPDLAALAAATWDEPDALARLLARAGELHLEGGLLRGERRLRTPADARALLLHQGLPEPVAAVLRERR